MVDREIFISLLPRYNGFSFCHRSGQYLDSIIRVRSRCYSREYPFPNDVIRIWAIDDTKGKSEREISLNRKNRKSTKEKL